MRQIRLDAYVLETLLPDLVFHDRQPSAFLVYLHLWYLAAGSRHPVEISHAGIASATGISKSAVQGAVRTLRRRQLVHVEQRTPTAVPRYRVLKPWRR